MRILQVIPYFIPAFSFGGPVKFSYLISKELVRRGHEVIVFTSDSYDPQNRLAKNIKQDPIEIVYNGIRIFYFRNLSMKSVKTMKFFITPTLTFYAKRMIDSFDVIHLHEYRTFQNIVVTYYSVKMNVPYVLQAHGSVPLMGSWFTMKLLYDNFFGKKILTNASKVIALTSFEAAQLIRMGVDPRKIVVIPLAIDLKEFENQSLSNNFRRKMNIDKDEKIVLFLGRIHWIKGIDILLRSFALLINKKKCRNIRLVIVGPDDGYLSQVTHLIKHLNLKKHVIVTGPLYGRDKIEVLMDADILVLPSRYETFPMVVLEAFACGKPVIASNVCGLKNIIINNVTGLLFRKCDVNDLAEKLYYIITNTEKLESMRSNCRKYVYNFSIEKITDKIENLYNNIVKT